MIIIYHIMIFFLSCKISMFELDYGRIMQIVGYLHYMNELLGTLYVQCSNMMFNIMN